MSQRPCPWASHRAVVAMTRLFPVQGTEAIQRSPPMDRFTQYDAVANFYDRRWQWYGDQHSSLRQIDGFPVAFWAGQTSCLSHSATEYSNPVIAIFPPCPVSPAESIISLTPISLTPWHFEHLAFPLLDYRVCRCGRKPG